jgi:hydrogenase maturation factor
VSTAVLSITAKAKKKEKERKEKEEDKMEVVSVCGNKTHTFTTARPLSIF